ncbi:hypothetical protein HYFRA_00013241 [Hymenoscyphus fraxineus]|uniref:Uncharacterized protein n=1 Tax=Hymenoscyphus fraxineus TaxID=746836 RepID=A0A9N9PYJ7_9HELO|nr:hypothetical protein HYFRA_00013241 [Hymenoscyphus fraxineus]
MFRASFVILLIISNLYPASGQLCYNPDSTIQSNASQMFDPGPWSDVHQAAPESMKCMGDTKACCYRRDACMTGRWCFSAWIAQIYRGGCTDPKWDNKSGCDFSCLSGQDKSDPTYITSCADGTACYRSIIDTDVASCCLKNSTLTRFMWNQEHINGQPFKSDALARVKCAEQ